MGAANTLPYLAGSGSVVAKSYADETLAYATYKWWQLIILPTLVWILGIIGELFVPILPFNVPRREFGVYSWLALFQYQARGFSSVTCARLNYQWPFRSCDLKQLTSSASSRALASWNFFFQTSGSSLRLRKARFEFSGLCQPGMGPCYDDHRCPCWCCIGRHALRTI